MIIPYKEKNNEICLDRCFIYRDIYINSVKCNDCRFFQGASDTVLKCGIDEYIEKKKYILETENATGKKKTNIKR